MSFVPPATKILATYPSSCSAPCTVPPRHSPRRAPSCSCVLKWVEAFHSWQYRCACRRRHQRHLMGARPDSELMAARAVHSRTFDSRIVPTSSALTLWKRLLLRRIYGFSSATVHAAAPEQAVMAMTIRVAIVMAKSVRIVTSAVTLQPVAWMMLLTVHLRLPVHGRLIRLNLCDYVASR